MERCAYEDEKIIRDLTQLDTPCFIINEEAFSNNIKEFDQACRKQFHSHILAYSVKTNALPYLLSLACANGMHAEVVSEDEYNLARASGFPINRIIYNGPLKSKETFIEALKNGAVVNIETKRELEWLTECDDLSNSSIGIRVNVNLKGLSQDISQDEEESRFGFDIENGEFSRAIEMINQSGTQVKGIHLHRTTATRSLENYAAISRFAKKVIENYDLKISYVDIGGGYYGKLPGKPDYNEYAGVIAENLGIKNITIILEPGNAVLASPIDYVMSVIDQKIVGEKSICTCDGTRLDIDPFFHKKRYQYELIGCNNDESESKQVICGCTCLEKDIITILENEKKLKTGDKIRMKWEGAYTMTLTPNFIRFLPSVYCYQNQSYKLVRKKWGTEQVLQNSIVTSVPTADGYLFLNAGRRATLIRDFKKSLGASANIVSADNWSVAAALYTADKYYLTPKINEPDYIDCVLNICDKEKIKVVTTCIDPEIEILAKNRDSFLERGILPLFPDEKTATLCFDKYEMYLFLKEHHIPTVLTYDSIEHFEEGLIRGEIQFPVFIKPRSGSGSVGAEKIDSKKKLEEVFAAPKYDYIIQEWMNCEDCDADVYIDTISHKAVAAFSKRKIETRIGGASKTIAFKDYRLFDFIRDICQLFHFSGPVDMDFFCQDGNYYLSEINPRFGGAYLHGFAAGVDFPKMIRNNIHGIMNDDVMGNYEDGSIMIMYDDVLMTNERDLRGDYHD